ELIECPEPFISVLPSPRDVETDFVGHRTVSKSHRRAVLGIVESRNIIGIRIVKVEGIQGNICPCGITTISNIHKSQGPSLRRYAIARIGIQLVEVTIATEKIEGRSRVYRAVR